MAKVHDEFIIELAEVIKGYGNDPDVKDPFRLSEFYRFYELPNIAVSRENFEKMKPLADEREYTEDDIRNTFNEGFACGQESATKALVDRIVLCKDCKRNIDNGGEYPDGRTRCPIQEHYALLQDGFCHLGERK